MRREWVPEWADWVSADTVEALREIYMPEMPPLDEGGYLVSYLLEIGPTVASGMGAGPIEWPQINAWCDRIGVDLQPFEARLLRRLSGEYLVESHRAEKLGCEPPWKTEAYKPEPSALQVSLRALASP